MSRARNAIQAPRIDPITFDTLTAGDPLELTRDGDIEASEYLDLTVAELSLPGASVASSRFEHVTADEVDLKGSRLTEVRLDRVGWPVVRAARGQWRDVRISGRVGALEAYESQWRGVHFVGCKLSFVNLRGAELMDVAFTDCTIEDLDLIGATARRVRLEDTRVASLTVHDAELADVDLRGATLATIDGLTSLRGATVSPEQLTMLAPLLAEVLGIRVD